MDWFLFPKIDHKTVKNKANSFVLPESMNFEAVSMKFAFEDDRFAGQFDQ